MTPHGRHLVKKKKKLHEKEFRMIAQALPFWIQDSLIPSLNLSIDIWCDDSISRVRSPVFISLDS